MPSDHVETQKPGLLMASVFNHNNPERLTKESIAMKPARTEVELNHRTPLAEPPYYLEIQARAYELYEQRGREDGHDLDDWLEAEAQLTRAARGEIRGMAA
jgi:Protein of unknown function (DUF2934)